MPFGLPFSNDQPGDALSATAILLPASTRSADQLPISPAEDIHTFLQKDLCVKRLNHIHQHLWLAGSPAPPRPLNYHLAASREICADERIDMHLVWESSRKFHLKPLPRYLLDADFWAKHLACGQPPFDAEDIPSSNTDKQHERVAYTQYQSKEELYKCALGFIYSYIALIRFESDLAIAHTYHLLPKEITWTKWLQLVQQLLKNKEIDPQNINPRYWFGELRLSRLNKIYAWRYGFLLQGYQYTYQTYGELFIDYLTPLTAATIYMALVLTAMQVGLATTHLTQSVAFQNASYGFTVFSILGPLVGVGIAGVIGLFQFTSNMVKTRGLKNSRFAKFEQMKDRVHIA